MKKILNRSEYANTKDLRFRGALSDEYQLNEKVYPHQQRLHKLLGKQIKKYCSVRKNSLCLEIGCGTGDTTKEVLAYNTGLRISCLDSSRSMLKQAKKNLTTHHTASLLDFVSADAVDFVQSTKQRYDVIFSAYTLHNIKRDLRKKLIRGIFRVLKRGGIFIELDIIYSPDTKLGATQFTWLAKQLDNYITLGRGDLQRKWLAHITADRNPQLILTEDELIKDLQRAGFKNLKRIKRYHSDAIFIARK